MGLLLAVPGVAFIVSPLRSKGRDESFETLTSLNQLDVGVPRSFSIIQERHDAWVKYPREPVGSVWLIRQPAGTDPPVLALTSECPHLGCAVNLSADGKGFLVPVPHQRIRLRWESQEPGPAAADGSTRRRTHQGERSRGAG